MRSLLRDHWDERALLAETDRVELMVEPFLSDRQRSSVDFDSIREFIRNRRADVAPEVAGDMPLWSSVPGPPPVFGEMQNEKKGKDKNLAPLAFFADARDGKTAAVEAHLENGIDVDANDAGGGTALGIAALAGQLEVMQLLIRNGADVNHANPDKNRPLHGAAFFGEAQAVELLLRSDADPNPLNNNMETPYNAASAAWSKELEGTIGFIATLVQVNADMTAIKTGRPKVLDVLRRYNGVPAAELSGPAQSSIWSAAKAGDLEAIKRLLDEGADADGHDPLGITPLSWAAIANQPEAVQLLIDLGASTAGRNGDGETALHGASFLGNDEVVEVLLRAGAPVNARNAKGETPLDGVSIPWSEQLQGIMTFVANFLQLKLDMEVVRAGRDRVATTLREHGAQLGETFR
jgi:ankyrin repeat protein